MSLVIGLAMGVLIFWAAAAPSATGAHSLIGGSSWDPYSGCMCCDDVDDEMDCEDGSEFYCKGPDFVGLIFGTSHTGQPNGDEACRDPGGESQCDNFFDSNCDDSCTIE